MNVHRFIPDYPGAQRGVLSCTPKLWVWRAPNMDSEVEDLNGNRLEVLGGINHEVTCKRCAKL